MENTQRRGMTFSEFIVYLVCGLIAAALAILVAIQFGWTPPQVLGPGINSLVPQPTIQVAQPQQPAVRPVQVQPAIVPTAYVPAVQQVEYQAAPPADVPAESVQPRTEVITVQRAPEQTTIIRTVPNKPSGPVIVIDKDKKCVGQCR